jgi:SAM-dependent methyltransferase
MQEAGRNGGYWDSYYRQQGVPELPSQFALFVANEVMTGELAAPAAVLDIGCGNGRDTLFFARLGFAVGALDRSEAAIALCGERLRRELGPAAAEARMHTGNADAGGLEALAAEFQGPLLLYSRFFFHAIDELAEAQVIGRAAAILKHRGGALAVEYRTTEDAAATKVTSDHYRRFIDPDAFAARVAAAGLAVQWRAEGRGMAKYRADDAHIARLIATP